MTGNGRTGGASATRRVIAVGWALLLLTAAGGATLAEGPGPAVAQEDETPALPQDVAWSGIAAGQQAMAASLLEALAHPGPSSHAGRVLAAARLAVDHRMGLVGHVLPGQAAEPLAAQAANLDLAHALRARAGAGGDPLARAVDTAGIVAGVAQSAAGEGAAGPRPGLPGATLRALAARQGHALDADAEQGLTRLNALPAPVRDALADHAAAFLAFDAAAREVFAAASAEAEGGAEDGRGSALREAWDAQLREAPGGGGAPEARGLDLAPVIAARARLLATVAPLRDALAATPLPAWAREPVQEPPLYSIDLGAADSTYTEDFALLVDAGGDDRYRNNAGGNNLLGGACAPQEDLAGAAALLDLGGSDAYGDPAAPRGCGANGGGASGAGLLVDAGGGAEDTDVFTAADFGTNGGGVLGAGMLLDASGGSVYAAGSAGANGGASTGAGLLVDGGGADAYRGGAAGVNGGAYGGRGALVDLGEAADTYTAGSWAANGGGAENGAGFLLDAGGPDAYAAGSFGTNGAAHGTGATGFLLDADGDDTYAAGLRGANGGGYGVAAAGMLVDLLGHDTYTAGKQGANGGAMGYGAAGFLFEGAGSDVYRAGHSGTNGGGRQAGVGLLVDASGDDLYHPDSDEGPPAFPRFEGSFGTNGGGYMGSVAALVDATGDDTYIAGHMGVNGGAWRSCIALGVCADAVGLLVDAQGLDAYDDDQGGSGTDRTVLLKGTAGNQVDLPLPSSGALPPLPPLPRLPGV